MTTGLRERKKAATRRALHEAALRLVAEHGLDGVSVDDVAARADVSPRTFFNCFATKDDAVLGLDPADLRRPAQVLTGRPADESAVEALRAVQREQAEETAGETELWPLRRGRAGRRLVRADAAAQAQHRAGRLRRHRHPVGGHDVPGVLHRPGRRPRLDRRPDPGPGGRLRRLGARLRAGEQRAAQPIVPLSLFRNPTFVVATALGAAIGLCVFSAIAFTPTFLQMASGTSAADSGLLMLPMMAGLFTTAIGSGIAMTRTGRYKAFPVVGVLVIAAAVLWMTTLSGDTRWSPSAWCCSSWAWASAWSCRSSSS